MREISEKNAEEGAELDPKTTRTTKPGVKRLFLTLSVLFSFILGFPFLWKSVEIHRSSLPFDDISHLESNPFLSFPCHFHALFLNFNPDLNPHHLQLSLLDQITKLTSHSSQCGTCTTDNLTLSVTLDSNSRCAQTSLTHDSTNLYQCGAVSALDFDRNINSDEDVDELLRSLFKGKNVYTVVVVNGGSSGGEGIRATVVGKYRHAWILWREEEEEKGLVSRVAETFVKVFVNGGRDQGLIHGEFMPVGADGRIVLSFSLLNAEPNNWIYDWY